MLAKYLRRRGWVVFYLEEQARQCPNDCWLNVYKSAEAAEQNVQWTGLHGLISMWFGAIASH